MKKVISISILLIFLFFIFQWAFIFYKKEHNISYKVYAENEVFEIQEIYQKASNDSYDIMIKNDNDTYFYLIKNEYNKQKEIIKEIIYYNENDNRCIYPILENGKGTYIECTKNGKNYTETSFTDQAFISKIKLDLTEKGYYVSQTINTENTKTIGKSTVYIDSLLTTDTITLWNYKGIDIISSDDQITRNALSFDKYENKHSYLVGKYYIVPNYLSSKVQEFNSVTIIDIENKETQELELNYTLSSNTYINGVVDQKLYYTDPSNLLQIEINPEKKNARLIGNKDIGGQIYQSGWKDKNIYDFVNNKILFEEEISSEVTSKYSYQYIIESGMSYYFYTTANEVYRVSKNHLDSPILLFQKSGINNFKVVEDTVYFVVNDTLYYFEEENGIIPVLKNNELRYNTVNRIDIYRKS